MDKKPLAGVRVLDLTQAYSGPFCTMNLADQGAEVIKIERAGVGDQTREWGPFLNGESGYFAYINRNKKGMTLDLKSDAGKEIFKELVKTADVVCENYKVGVMEKMGLSYEVLKEINPRIIYASISGFGIGNELSSRPAYDIVAQAMSGMMSVTGFPENGPTKIGPSIGDNYSGAYLCIGILCALYERERTGLGQRIDVSMVDTLFSVLENFVVNYTIGGFNPTRAGNADPSIAPFDSFRAKDGEFVLGCGTDKMFAALCHLMNREDLLADERFTTNGKRCDNYLPDLKAAIEAWTTTKTIAELEELIVAEGIPFGVIQDIKTVSDSKLIKERNMLWHVYQPGMNKEIAIPGCPVKMHSHEDAIQKAAPLLGEDTDEILKTILGKTDAEIAELKANGVV